MSDEKPSRDKVIAEVTEETRMRGFVEYPKMLHKTDGSNVVVTNKKEEEEALRSGDVHPTPADAIKEKERRDAAEAAKAAKGAKS